MDRLRLNESSGGNFILQTYNIVNVKTTTKCSSIYIKQNHMSLRWNGLNVEDARSWSDSALRLAAANGHLDVVRYLCGITGQKFKATQCWKIEILP